MTLGQEHEASNIYTNVQLEDASTSIRLLHLQPQNHSDANSAIDCHMETWPLSEVPNFLAISYTWGDPNSQATIMVNHDLVTVRKNCNDALWQARLHYPSSFVWIDSVCINQADLDEKGAQVALMASIYACSHEVLACIGDRDEHSDAVRRASEALGAEATRIDFDFGKDEIFPRFASWIQEHKDSYLPQLLPSYQEFCERPYFSRLWIAQELYAGDIYVTFLCGEHCINWQHLWLLDDVMAIYCATATGWSISTIGKLRMLLEAPADAAHPFPGYLMWAKDLLCQEPRDRVYGTLGVVEWSAHDLQAPTPDYRRPTWDIAVDLLRNMLSIGRPYLSEVDYITSALRLTKDSPEAVAWLHNSSFSTDGSLMTRNAWRFQATLGSTVDCDDDQRPSAMFRLGEPGPPELHRAALDQLLCHAHNQHRTSSDTIATAPSVLRRLTGIYTNNQISALVNGTAEAGDILVDLNQLDLGSTGQGFALVVRPTKHERDFEIVGTAILVEGYALGEFTYPCRCFGGMVEDDAIMRSASGIWCEFDATNDAVLILSSLAKESLHTKDVGEVLAIVAACVGTRLRVTSLIKSHTGEVQRRPILQHLLESHRKPHVNAQPIDDATDLGQYRGILPSGVKERWSQQSAGVK